MPAHSTQDSVKQKKQMIYIAVLCNPKITAEPFYNTPLFIVPYAAAKNTTLLAQRRSQGTKLYCLVNRGTLGENNLPRVVARIMPRSESNPATSWSRVQRPTATPPWDVTVPDTYADSHLGDYSTSGSWQAATDKEAKYSSWPKATSLYQMLQSQPGPGTTNQWNAWTLPTNDSHHWRHQRSNLPVPVSWLSNG